MEPQPWTSNEAGVPGWWFTIAAVVEIAWLAVLAWMAWR